MKNEFSRDEKQLNCWITTCQLLDNGDKVSRNVKMKGKSERKGRKRSDFGMSLIKFDVSNQSLIEQWVRRWTVMIEIKRKIENMQFLTLKIESSKLLFMLQDKFETLQNLCSDS